MNILYNEHDQFEWNIIWIVFCVIDVSLCLWIYDMRWVHFSHGWHMMWLSYKAYLVIGQRDSSLCEACAGEI